MENVAFYLHIQCNSMKKLHHCMVAYLRHNSRSNHYSYNIQSSQNVLSLADMNTPQTCSMVLTIIVYFGLPPSLKEYCLSFLEYLCSSPEHSHPDNPEAVQVENLACSFYRLGITNIEKSSYNTINNKIFLIFYLSFL